jgi:hypothetical protein
MAPGVFGNIRALGLIEEIKNPVLAGASGFRVHLNVGAVVNQ